MPPSPPQAPSTPRARLRRDASRAKLRRARRRLVRRLGRGLLRLHVVLEPSVDHLDAVGLLTGGPGLEGPTDDERLALAVIGVDLLVVEFGDGGIDDGGTELAKVDDLGAGEALLDQALKGKVDDLGRLLILGADVAVGCLGLIEVVGEKLKDG